MKIGVKGEKKGKGKQGQEGMGFFSGNSSF